MSDLKDRLLRRIASREAHIGVVGLGYVGLPLVVGLANAGFHVVGVDVNAEKVALLLQGRSYIEDVPDGTLAPLVESGRFRATTDYAALADVDAISVCVPTPLRKTRDPDISYIVDAAERIASLNATGKLLVLESTTYPGTTEEVILPLLSEDGQVAGRDFFLAFSPERIDPGRVDFTLHNTPKVIGGMTPACLEVALALYGTVVENPVPVSSTAAAEMVKLLENTFRAVNIGLVNEIALMCDRLGLDVWEVIRAAATKPYGYMTFYPGPGLGGHCIPIDPLYLSWKLRTLNFTARFIELADTINKQMPEHVVTKVADALNDDGKAVRGSKILLAGVAYKPNVGDTRESPALDIIHLLQTKGAEIRYHDPFVANLAHEHFDLRSEPLTDAVLSDADCVVIVTNHDVVDHDRIRTQARLIVDTRNAVAPGAGARVVKL